MYLYLCMWMCQSNPQLALVSPALVLARSAPAPAPAAAAAAADVEKSRKKRRVTATIHPPESIFWPAFVSGSLSLTVVSSDSRTFRTFSSLVPRLFMIICVQLVPCSSHVDDGCMLYAVW